MRVFHSHLHRLFVALFGLLSFSIEGCGADRFDGHVYHEGRESFRIGPTGAHWRRIHVDGPLLAYRDDADGGAVDVYARCGQDGDDVPLAALTQHLLIGFTDRNIEAQDTMPFDGREAMRTLATGKLDGVAVSLALYVLKKDGCVYDIAYVAEPAHFTGGVDTFDAFARGFSTGTGGKP